MCRIAVVSTTFKVRAAILCKFMQVQEARLQQANAHDARHVHDCSHQCFMSNVLKSVMDVEIVRMHCLLYALR